MAEGRLCFGDPFEGVGFLGGVSEFAVEGQFLIGVVEGLCVLAGAVGVPLRPGDRLRVPAAAMVRPPLCVMAGGVRCYGMPDPFRRFAS